MAQNQSTLMSQNVRHVGFKLMLQWQDIWKSRGLIWWVEVP